jgi:hypothetical protein
MIENWLNIKRDVVLKFYTFFFDVRRQQFSFVMKRKIIQLYLAFNNEKKRKCIVPYTLSRIKLIFPPTFFLKMNIYDVLFGLKHHKKHILPYSALRAGKSPKMSKRGLFLSVKCPQSCVEEILQNRQLYLI